MREPQKKRKEPATTAAPADTGNLRPETPLLEGASASDGDGDVLASAGPSEARLPGEGGDETLASGDDAGVDVGVSEVAGGVAGVADSGEEAFWGAGAEADVFGEPADGVGALEALGVAAAGEDAFGAAALEDEVLGAGAWAGDDAADTDAATARATSARTMSRCTIFSFRVRFGSQRCSTSSIFYEEKHCTAIRIEGR